MIFRSIRLRLTLWYIALLAVILAAFSGGIYLTLRHNLYANLDDALETRSDDLLAAVEVRSGAPTLNGLAPAGPGDEGEQFVRLFDVSGSIVFESGLTAEDRFDEGGALDDALGGATVTRRADAGDETFRARLTPVVHDGAAVGVLEVARSEGDVTDTLHTLLLILGLSYPATIALASFGGVFLAWRALGPIDEITRVARRLSAEDLSRRLDLSLPDDELGRLAHTFDDMLARLDRAFQQQRQFTADASHELRTPLTSIKGQVEVALTKERSPDAYREILGSVNEEVDRLIRLVGSLLTLARADAGQIAIERERVDAGDLVAGAVEHVRPAAEARGLTLELTPGPQAALNADHDLLLQLLLNLLDNAVKYTPAGGSVAAGWTQEGTAVRLTVHDSGPGLAPDEQARIFDRFYRVDTARSRAEGGIGLGLSIAKWIAEAHGGSIAVVSAPGASTTFTVTLPA